MPAPIDLSCQRFGRLTAIWPTGRTAGTGNAVWLCWCECGYTTDVAAHSLRHGGTESCYECSEAARVRGRAAGAAANRRKGVERRASVRKLLADGRTQAEIAKILGVSRQRVSQIVNESSHA